MRLNNSFSRFMTVLLMAEATTEGTPGSTTTTEPVTTTTAPTTSVLSSANAGTDYIPAEYRTNKEDGSLDLEASSRKIAEAYTTLKTRSGEAPPATAEDYAPKIEAEGFDWEEFKSDEGTQSFLKGAHAKGLTNDQVSFVIGEYLRVAPELIGGAAVLTQQDCTTALKAIWTDDQAMSTNVRASYRAAEAFASEKGKPGNFDALMAKYGNDPDFIAFTANIGKELKEDNPINSGNSINDQDFAVKSGDLRAQLQALPAHDPKRKGIQQQLDDMYNAKYGKAQSRLA
jgi:hypothetical protein